MHKLVVGGYDLDLPVDFGILISKSVGDIREPGDRNADWTKTISLPGTHTNRKAFTHLFDLNIEIRNTSATNFNPDFNPNLKAPAKHYKDEVLQINGFLRLNNIIQTDYDTLEFECTLYSKLADLFSSITEAKLRDLDFTEFNHTLTVARITETWDTRIQKNGIDFDNFDASGNPTGDGYVYALIDDGSYVNYYGDTNASQFYPALYKKQIVDKIFEAAGYEYTSDSWFNTTRFKRDIVPCPTGMRLSQDDIDNKEFEAESAGQAISSTFTQVEFTTENFDPGSHYNNTTSQYEGSQNGEFHDFYFVCDAAFSGLLATTAYVAVFGLYRNGVLIGGTSPIFGGTTDAGGNLVVDKTFVYANVAVNDGDLMDVRFIGIQRLPSGGAPSSFTFTINAGSLFFNKYKSISWGLGGPVDFSAFFNDETTQYDFLKSVFNEYNIYAEPDPDNEQKIYLNPRDDFYRSTVRDWTQKLDQSSPLDIVPMGELDANPYYFTHTKGEDTENKDYQSAYNRNYGDKKYFIQNDFLKNEKKIEVIFAPSQLNKADGYDKVLTLIPLQMDNGTGQLRSLYYGGLKTCNSYEIFDSPLMSGTSTTRTEYPLTLHLDDPDSPTIDLNFGMPRRINLPAGNSYTNNNLFNAYWKNYIDQITDKNSKIVRGKFSITPADMELLSFRDLYYFERNYFRLNAINDYNPDVDLTECEFLQLTQDVPFVTEAGNTEGGQDGFGDEFPFTERRRGVDGSLLGQIGLVVGRDNGSSGGQGLIVGDRISGAPTSRINSAIGSENIYFGPGVEKATVINSNDISVDASGQFWIQNEQVDIFNPSLGDAIVYNGTKWTPGSPGLTVASGLYTPELDNVNNISSSDAYECQWSRAGNVVTVSGRVDIENIVTGTLTVLGMTLPIATTIYNTYQLAGAAAGFSLPGLSSSIRGGPSDNDAQFRYLAVAGYYEFYFTFTYSIQ